MISHKIRSLTSCATPPGKNGEILVTLILRVQARKGRVITYRFQGKRFDCGSIDGFVAATNHFYQMQELGGEPPDGS